MAADGTVTIKIILEGSEKNQTDTKNQTGSPENVSAASSGANQSVAGESGSGQASEDTGLTQVKYFGAQVANMILGEAEAWAVYEWNKSLQLSDDYIAQRDFSIARQQISRAVSDVSTIASSTASGAMVGGAIGAVIGFVLGTGKVIASTIRENKQGAEQQEIALRQMDLQLDFTRQRAGWSTQAASIGEDL